MDDRLHPEGVRRHELKWVLGQARFVRVAVSTDRCLLCRNPNVNEAGLCNVCWTYLTDEELAVAERWTAGTAP